MSNFVLKRLRLGKRGVSTKRFVETYPKRAWASYLYDVRDTTIPNVVSLTHPSRADWTNEKADPTALVKDAMKLRGML